MENIWDDVSDNAMEYNYIAINFTAHIAIQISD